MPKRKNGTPASRAAELEELKDEVQRWKRRYRSEKDRNAKLEEDVSDMVPRGDMLHWKRRYQGERERNQELLDDVERMEGKLKAATTLLAAASSSSASSSAPPRARARAAASESTTAGATPSADDACPDAGASDDPPPFDPKSVAKTRAVDGRSGYDDKWLARLEDMRRYREEHGHCNVPAKDKNLGRWVNAQRTNYSYLMRGERSAMTLERINKLEEIGFEWKWKHPGKRKKIDAGEDGDEGEGDADDGGDGARRERKRSGYLERAERQWRKQFELLAAYRDEHGDCAVPYSKRGLGSWCSHQRCEYKYFLRGKKSRLTPERVDELESVGFDWEFAKAPKKKEEEEEAEGGGIATTEDAEMGSR